MLFALRLCEGGGTAGAVIFLLVTAVLRLFGVFASDAAVLGLICDCVKSLFGAGFFTLPYVLLLLALLLGTRNAEFTPVMDIAPLRGRNLLALAFYGAYLLIPTVLHIKEAIQWHISRSRI